MGGFGSGQRGGKDCTGDMRQVDVRRLHREGHLKPGMAYNRQWTRNGEVISSIGMSVQADLVRFTYRHRPAGGDWQDVHCPAYLERTPCTYGGTRAWWLCPTCGKRCAILYIGKTPACRHCYRLAYRSERETTSDRATRQVNKLRDRLDWEPGFLNGNGPKPKGMHWRTFYRLRAQHDAYMQQTLAGVAQMLGRLNAKLGAVRRG